MQSLETRLLKKNIQKKRNTARRIGVGLLSLLVLLGTAVSLLLPAFTLEKDTFCGLEEHVHTDACYRLVPICGEAEREGHAHTDACIGTERLLICDLPEIEGHIHSDACYTQTPELVCALPEDEGHTHGEGCYEIELMPACGLVEDAGHTHDEFCFISEWVPACGLEEDETHQHDDSCYIEQLVPICGEEERPAHFHDDSCFVEERFLICMEEERPAHFHGEDCYTMNRVLTCELEETEGHTHTDDCWLVSEAYICGLEEDAGHTHTDACYEAELICGQEEHTHTLQCYADPEADLENELTWLASFPVFAEDATRLERLLGIAASQLGYHESAVNYQVDEDGTVRGYTRCGEFCGEPYADWNAMFVTFCLYYAGIDETVFPAGMDANTWLDTLYLRELYIDRDSGYVPQAGDLVFYENGTLRVALVESLDAENGLFLAIEGDSEDAVAQGQFSLNDEYILGYGLVAEALRRDEAAAALDVAQGMDTQEEAAALAGDTDAQEEAAALTGDTDAQEEAAALTGETDAPKTPAEDGNTAPQLAAGAENPGETDGEADTNTEIETETGTENETQPGTENETQPGTEDQSEQKPADEAKDKSESVTEDKPADKAADKTAAEADGAAGEENALLVKKLAGSVTPLGDSAEEIKLEELATINPTKLVFTDTEHDALLDFGFSFSIPDEKIPYAKSHTPWVFDLSNIVGVDKPISELNGTGGIMRSGYQQTGTYVIDGNKILITPDKEYMDTVETNLHGSFAFKAQLNENVNNNEEKTTIGFPGGGSVTVQYKKKNVNHYKSVSSALDSWGTNSGDIQVVQDNGKYYLYYVISMKPDSNLNTLTLTDTLSEGQTIDYSSIELSDGSTKVMVTDDKFSTHTGSDFALNVASLLDGGVAKANTEYKLTYRAEVDPGYLNTELTNTADYTWNGGNETDTTKVTPKFEEELRTDKYVGGSADNIYATSGNVEVHEDNGTYYLYYRVTATPNINVDSLMLTDTIGAGQEYDSDYGMKLKVGENEIIPSPFTASEQQISGTLTYDIPANTTVELTYRVKLTKNVGSDAGVLGTVKENTSQWTWNGRTEPENKTTVTPREPVPQIYIHKSADLAMAAPGSTITYTIEVGDDDTNLSGKTISDYIANYVSLDGSVKVTKADDSPVTGVEVTYHDPGDTPVGAEYKLFDLTFPTKENYTGKYIITYTVTVNANADLAGRRTLLNRGEIGENGQDDTTVTVDYGPLPEVSKALDSFDKTTNTVKWTVTLTVPADRTYKNVVLTERDFCGGESQWNLYEQMPIDWSNVTFTPGDVVYKPDATNNTITFDTLSQSVVITLVTQLPEGKSFADLDTYYVRNGVDLTVDGEGAGGVTVTEKYEKADYSFTKEGKLDPENSHQAIWTVTLNPERRKIEPDIIPYFVDTIPDGMKFVPNSMSVTIDGSGNFNAYGNQIWNWTLSYPYTTSDNTIGRINLAEAVCNEWMPEQSKPTGLSGMKYTVTYRTELTNEMIEKVENEVGHYSFTNKAKIVDSGGKSIKSTSDTVEYVYEELVEKRDLSDEALSENKITYEIDVNKGGKTINSGKPLELYDIFGTDVTLLPDTLRIYEGSVDESTLCYSSARAEGNATDIVVGYEDNTRRLEIILPDSKYYIVRYSVVPSGGDKSYENSAILKTDLLTSVSTTEKDHTLTSEGTLSGSSGRVSLKKLDQYNITKPLPGAKFALYEAQLAADGSILGADQIRSDESDGEYTTNADGMVYFTQVTEGKLYYWVETAAPDGYMLTDPSPHYFVIYKEYQNDAAKLPADYPLADLPDELRSRIISELSLDDSASSFNPQALSGNNVLLTDFVNYLNDTSSARAKELDHRAQTANGIIVATVADDYLWSWRNTETSAWVQLKGLKTMIGRQMKNREFVFQLDDITKPETPIRLQKVTNTATNNKVGGSEATYTEEFVFSKIGYVRPGVYRYRIREVNSDSSDDSYAIRDPNVIYDNSVYEVEVTVTEDDLIFDKDENPEGKPIPDNQIVYLKNGQAVDSARFYNREDQASITLNKTFSGDFVSTDAFEKSGVKDRVTFIVRDKATNQIIKTIRYSEMPAGTITLTAIDGIQSNRTYTVEEQNADVSGAVRSTFYTVKAITQQYGDAPVELALTDKAAEITFDNRYEPESMSLMVHKGWYTIEKDQSGNERMNMVNPPANVREVYFKLQRYIGSETDLTDESKNNPADWIFLNRSYEAESDQYTNPAKEFSETVFSFSDAPYALKYTLGWGLELEGLPIGRYRVVEVEPREDKWKPINPGNVVYSIGQKDQLAEIEPGHGDKKAYEGVPGTADTNNPELYAYNRLYEIHYVKAWKDLNGAEVTNPYTELGVQSVTFSLQSATCENEKDDAEKQNFSEWTDTGKKATLTFNETTPTAEQLTMTFTGITRKDEEGNVLFYRVQEVEMVLKDGTKLIGAEQIGKMFDLKHVPKGKKVTGQTEPSEDIFDAYLKPSNGGNWDTQNVTNTLKRTGITVKKQWKAAGEPAPPYIYFQLQVFRYGSFTTVYNIKADDGTGPNANGIYTLTYDSRTGEYSTLTFSNLFRKSADGTLLDTPVYEGNFIDGVRFLEVKGEDDPTPYGDDTHAATYTFKPESGELIPDARIRGIDPTAVGDYTIVNAERKNTKLNVTKSWPGNDTVDTIYYQVYAILEDGSTQVIYQNMPNVTVTEGTWENWDRLSLTSSKPTENIWPTTTFEIPGKLSVNGQDKYVASFYVVETDQNGSERVTDENMRVSYTYSAEGSAEISKTATIPSGSNGTVTIWNTPKSGPAITKQWKQGDTLVPWPGNVASVTVQLWQKATPKERSTSESVTTPIGDPVVLTSAEPAHAWDEQITEDVNYTYTYYVEETQIVAVVNGVSQTLTGDALDEWFADTAALDGKPHTVEVDLSGEMVFLNNMPHDEEPTTLYFSKRWMDESGSLVTPEAGEKIYLRLWSKALNEDTATPVTDFTGITVANATWDETDKRLILTSGGGTWPTGSLRLPKYRNGQLIRYYLEETDAVDSTGKHLNYTVTYELNGQNRGEAENCLVSSGTITTVNTRTSKYITVEKRWDDAHSHATEQVTVQLYSWQSDTPISPDGASGAAASTSKLTVKVEKPGDDVAWWSFSFDKITIQNPYTELPATSFRANNNTASTELEKTFDLPLDALGGETGNFEIWFWGDGDRTKLSTFTVKVDERDPVTMDIHSGNNIVFPTTGDHTITVTFQPPVSSSSRRYMKMGTISLFNAEPVTTSLDLNSLPAGATAVGDPVVLNRGANGWTYTWTGLDADKYYAVVETKLEGTTATRNESTYTYTYSDNTTSTGTIIRDKQITKVEITNKATYPITTEASLRVVKVDQNNRETQLDGAVFELYKRDGSAWVKPEGIEPAYTDDTNKRYTIPEGGITFSHLTAGDYKLKEISAPVGYVAVHSEVFFTISERGVLSSPNSDVVRYQSGLLSVGNQYGVELPATGGAGAEGYRIGGALLLVGAAGIAAAPQGKRLRASRARRRKGGDGAA